ncbi:hypothetical protein [Streptomyces phaeochromogenes]|uniref:hypothetical protein n=1 Tax=Streptomyces phaeochromogenes TaxID=1923 RepID=UPI003868CDBE|nr:hypothetical protein OHB08_06120 [Streptomyces phaeochromogenes]
MRAGAGLRSLIPLLVCGVMAATAGCGGSTDEQGGESLELEAKWHDRISEAVNAKPDGCTAGVGSACETHAAAVHAITERLHKEVEARPDKDRYQATLDGTTAINEQYDQYYTELCATVPETTVDAATTQKLHTCSGLYTSIITGASDLQDNLRPSE